MIPSQKTYYGAIPFHPSAPPLINGVDLVPAATIPPESVDWIWPGWLAKGKFHLLAGPAGTGKTTLAVSLIAAISQGHAGRTKLPDGTYPRAGQVVFYTCEDGIEDTIIPRLIAADADMSKVHIIRGTRENRKLRSFEFDADLQKLRDEIAKIGDVVLLVIDSIVHAVCGDSNKNSAVRKSLAPLLGIGEDFGCAILGLTHVNKASKGKEPMDRVTGSLAFVALARVVWLTAKINSTAPDEPIAKAMVVRVKSNLGKSDGGFGYEIHPATIQGPRGPIATSKIVWNEQPLQGTAKDLLKFAESGGELDCSSAVESAAKFLNGLLSNGGMPYPQIEAMARMQDPQISLASIKRAKAELRIDSRKQMGAGQASPSIWSLPTPQELRMGGPSHAPYQAPQQFAKNPWEELHVPRDPEQSQHDASPPPTEPEHEPEPEPETILDQHWPEPEMEPDVDVFLIEGADHSLDGPNGDAFFSSCVSEVRSVLAEGPCEFEPEGLVNREDYAISMAIQQVFGGFISSGDAKEYVDKLSGLNWAKDLGAGSH